MDDVRRQRLFAELGLTWYRLRRAATAVADRSVDPASQSNDQVVRLHVTAADATGVPAGSEAHAIWVQVLDWLGYAEGEVIWALADAPDAIQLPPVGEWRTPAGKRGLWLALNAHVRHHH